MLSVCLVFLANREKGFPPASFGILSVMLDRREKRETLVGCVVYELLFAAAAAAQSRESAASEKRNDDDDHPLSSSCSSLITVRHEEHMMGNYYYTLAGKRMV